LPFRIPCARLSRQIRPSDARAKRGVRVPISSVRFGFASLETRYVGEDFGIVIGAPTPESIGKLGRAP